MRESERVGEKEREREDRKREKERDMGEKLESPQQCDYYA